jgi:hypothetical protein
MDYLFYIEGLNREEWVSGETEKFARTKLWQSLTNYEQDDVVQIECLDKREGATA